MKMTMFAEGYGGAVLKFGPNQAVLGRGLMWFEQLLDWDIGA